MKQLCKGVIIIGLMTLLPAAISAQNCDLIDVEVTAEISTDSGYEGLYKYTVSGSWAISGNEEGQAISHIDFLIGVECPCFCDSSMGSVLFPNPAGTSTGENDRGVACEVRYNGMVACGGLPETSFDVLKYEILGAKCTPLDTGSGTWIYYSTMAPLPWAEYNDAVIIKYGEMICYGTLRGQLPDCLECIPVSTEHGSWGSMKSLYR